MRQKFWGTTAKVALLSVFLLASLEGLGALALRIHLGRLPSLSDLRSQRERIVARGPGIDTITGKDRPRTVEIIHPYLGFVYDPAANSPGFSSLHDGIGVNGFGLLDLGSPIRSPTPDETIVGITGGSLAFWFSTKGIQALERELRSSPRLRNRKLTFVRLALGGYKEPQQLVLLSYLLSQGAHFDVLINIDGFNEVALPPEENLRAGVNPVYPRAWPLFVAGLDLGERTILVASILTRNDRRSWWAAWMDRTPFGLSFAGNAVWKMMDDMAAGEVAAAAARISTLELGKQAYYITGPPTHYKDAAEIVAAVIPIWRDSSIQLDRLCRGNGIYYFHFLQPNQYDPGSKPIGADEARIALHKDHPYAPGVVLGYPLLRLAGLELKKAGVTFTDLSRVFVDHPEPLYHDDCCHLNIRGNELLAGFIGNVIVERLSSAR